MKHIKHGNKKDIFSGEVYGKCIPRLETIDVNSTILDIKKMIYNKVKHIYKDDHPIHVEAKQEEQINKCIALHIYDNIPFYAQGKYGTRMKGQCEFCKSNHGSSDTCDMKVGTVSANSEEGSRTIKFRDVLEKMEHNRNLVVGVIFKEGTQAQVKLLEPEYDTT